MRTFCVDFITSREVTFMNLPFVVWVKSWGNGGAAHNVAPDVVVGLLLLLLLTVLLSLLGFYEIWLRGLVLQVFCFETAYKEYFDIQLYFCKWSIKQFILAVLSEAWHKYIFLAKRFRKKICYSIINYCCAEKMSKCINLAQCFHSRRVFER